MEPIKTADTAELPSPSAPRFDGVKARRTGLVGVDGRRREAKAWLRHYSEAMDRTGGRSQQLCKSYASLAVRREAMDAEVAAGAPVDTDLLLRVSGEIRRLARHLGIISDADDDGDGIDGTEAAIAAARAHIRGEAA